MRNNVSRTVGFAVAAIGVVVIAASVIGGLVLTGTRHAPPSDDSTVSVSNDVADTPSDDGAKEPVEGSTGATTSRPDDGPGEAPSAESPTDGSTGECVGEHDDDDGDQDDDGSESDHDC